MVKEKDRDEFNKASHNVKKIAKETQFMGSEDKKKLRGALLRLWKASQ